LISREQYHLLSHFSFYLPIFKAHRARNIFSVYLVFSSTGFATVGCTLGIIGLVGCSIWIEVLRLERMGLGEAIVTERRKLGKYIEVLRLYDSVCIK